MKTIYYILLTLFFSSCDTYPIYRLEEVSFVPDSNKAKMRDWIIKSVSAASYHMSAGDYEDPEDLIWQSTRTADDLFSVSEPGIGIEVSTL